MMIEISCYCLGNNIKCVSQLNYLLPVYGIYT